MEIASIKDIIDKPSFQKFCNETIISNQKVDHLVIGYHPFNTDLKEELVEGAYLIIVDDVLYFIDCESYYIEKTPYYKGNFIVVGESSINCTDYILELDQKLLKFSWINKKKIEVPITQDQIERILHYKESYRKKLSESKFFQNILNQQIINTPKLSTNIGFIVNNEDHHSVLPYHCYMVLNDEETYILNVYFEFEHRLEVNTYKFSISTLLSRLDNINKTIELQNYPQHNNKVFNLKDEQLTMILKHHQLLLDAAEEERKRIELLAAENKEREDLAKKAKVTLIQSINRCGLELSRGAQSKEILMNFIIKHTDHYFLDLKNHSFIEVSKSVEMSVNVPENLHKSLNMLETLFIRRGYLENNIAKENSLLVIIMAIQYTSIDYYSKQFQLKFNKFVEKVDKLTLTDSLHQFIEISNIDYTELEYNSFIHFLINKQKIDYDSKIKEKLITIKSMINEFLEERELTLFEASLLESTILSPITMDDLDKMDGAEFESFIAELFFKMGFQTKVTKGSHDQGIDIIAANLIESIGMQVKRYNLENRVSNKAIQEVFGGLNYYNLQKGMVVTSSFFTNSAKELAHSNNIILWDRFDLEKYLKMYY